MKPTIALVMIVRNEETNLSACLESARDAVDEIVIVDTGSTDRTVEIARRYTGQVYHYPWRGDFSAARNYALDRAKSRWVLSLDADEELDTTGGDLRTLVNAPGGREAFFLPLHSRGPEPGGDFSRFLVLRLFRNKAEYRFQGRIHEQVTVRRPEAVSIAGAPVIWHKPLSAKERNRKRGRNLALLRRALSADPANPFLQYYLGVEWLGLGKAARALPCFQEACARLTDGHILFRAPAVRFLAACLKALGRLDEAICLCLEESRRYPFYTDLFFDTGLLFETKGECAVALKWFQEALRLGPPPPLFSHTNGTESFLAFYHLGSCHEKLGARKEAQDCYEQALAVNQEFIYPLYNLFLLCLAGKGPRGAFRHFKAAGCLNHPRQAATLAGLFFEAGWPDLACACLEEGSSGHGPSNIGPPGHGPAKVAPPPADPSHTGPPEADPPDAGSPDAGRARLLARFCVYAGRWGEALALLDRVSREEDVCTGPFPVIDEIVALILQEDYRTAKERALALWRRPAGRGPAWALLNLIALAGSGSPCGRPEKNHEPAVIQTALTVLENCLRSRTGRPGRADEPAAGRYLLLVEKTMQFLAQLSPRGCAALVAYLEEKANAVRHLMEYKFGPAGGLFS